MTDREQGRSAVFIQPVLTAASVLYGLAVDCHSRCYASGWLPRYTLSKPVISVGNITLGGVGKTPLVEMLVRYIQDKKYNPAILTHGYHPGCAGIMKGQSDEAVLLSETCPGLKVAVGRDRLGKAREILAGGNVDIFLMDDGFQHRRLARDLDIVAVDALNPFGNGRLLPRGILREPVASLKRADVIVITKSDLGAANLPAIQRVLDTHGIRCPVFRSVHRPQSFRNLADGAEMDLGVIGRKPVCLLSAIGDPGSFERLISGLGADVRRHFIFTDHHWFVEKDIGRVLDFCRREKTAYLVTTRKDAVRLRPFREEIRQVVGGLALGITADIDHERESFFARIDHLLRH